MSSALLARPIPVDDGTLAAARPDVILTGAFEEVWLLAAEAVVGDVRRLPT